MEDVSVIEYLRLIKLNLIGDKHKKEEFTASLKDNLSNYLAEHPQVTLDELFTEFGTPEEVSEEFAAAFRSSSLADAKTKSWAIKVFVAVGIFVAAVIVFCTIYNLCQHENFRNGYYVETVSESEMASSPESSVEYY